MIKESLLNFHIEKNTAIPHFLQTTDLVWLRPLVDEYKRYIGKPRSELKKRWSESFPFSVSKNQRNLVLAVLEVISKTKKNTPAISPTLLREKIFLLSQQILATQTDSDQNTDFWLEHRRACISQLAQEHKWKAREIADMMLFDLRDNRIVPDLAIDFDLNLLLQDCNLLIAKGFLCRARKVKITLIGDSRRVIRLAKLTGLICSISRIDSRNQIEISGPISLFRFTLLYGRQLAQILPSLFFSNHFELVAECKIGDRFLEVKFDSNSPIKNSRNLPSQFDSKLEEKFYRDFMKFYIQWDLIREPEPIESGNSLIFPDFLIRSRINPKQFYYLEIVGFWTTEYLNKKLRTLEKAEIKNLILCIDQKRHCALEPFNLTTNFIEYTSKIDVAKLAAILTHGIESGAKIS